MQLFHHTGGFLLQHLEYAGTWKLVPNHFFLRATFSTTGNQEDQQIQLIRNKKKGEKQILLGQRHLETRKWKL
jgi:hypothetical protein